ncbi:MAG: ribosome silencing factor [Gammaproteobacteria bacterium]|nr:MAG: ribosome silencing factor [Gammaproteobacteria bacterium]
MQSDRLRQLAVDALEDLKAVDILELDVRKLSNFTDYMIIASGRSARQVAALADNVVMKAKQSGEAPLGVEGMRAGEWVLVDLGDVVVHVMQPDVREFYQLEKLWSSREIPAHQLPRGVAS